jgi:hypothetical protein
MSSFVKFTIKIYILITIDFLVIFDSFLYLTTQWKLSIR